MRLPSKKVLSLLLISISLVAFIVLVFGKKNTAGQKILASTLRAGDELSLPTNSNWQDVLTTNNQLGNENLATSTESTGLTDQVSLLMMSNYLSLKQSGDIDQNDVANIINEIKPYTDDVNLYQIKSSELNILNNYDNEDIAKYGEDVGKILKNNKPQESKNEILILQEFITKKEPEKIKDLREASRVYSILASELKKMPVPSIFLKAHMDTVNGMNNLAVGLNEIEKVFEDPMFALKGLSVYQAGGDMFIQSVRASSEFIKNKGVVYKQGSGGYYLLYGI